VEGSGAASFLYHERRWLILLGGSVRAVSELKTRWLLSPEHIGG
jgi:hypothetical protein